MSEFRLSFPACVIAGKSRLTAEDLNMLRNVTFPNGLRTTDGAIILLALHNSCPQKCAEWDRFFIEAITDFIVHYSYPQGSLDDINVAWLIRMLSNDGVVNSAIELELILNVIDASANVPPAMSVFALEQLRMALSDGAGIYRHLRTIERNGITRQDLDYVRRVLRSSSTEKGVTLSPMEFAVLQRIDQATQPGANHPGWSELMGNIRLRDADGLRPSRWLRVSDDMLAEDSAAA